MKASMMTTAGALVAAVALLTLLPTATEAMPPLPSNFYGTVKLNGSNVPDGTQVSAWIGGVKYAETETTTYEGDSVYALDVPGDDADTPEKDGGVEGETIVFKVADDTADQTGTWHSGTSVALNLIVAEAAVTLTPTTTSTPTPTNTPTPTPTLTPGLKGYLPHILKNYPPASQPFITGTPTRTATPTLTPTRTPTRTATPSGTLIPTPQPTITGTPTRTARAEFSAPFSVSGAAGYWRHMQPGFNTSGSVTRTAAPR